MLGANKIPWVTPALILAFFSLTLLVFGPGTVYLTNANEFTNTYLDLFLAGILLATAVSFLLAALLLGLRALGTKFHEKGLSVIFAVAFLLWLQGNFLLWSYGPLDGRDIPWSKMARFGYIDGAIWIGGLVVAAVLSRFVVRNAGKACLFLLIIQIGYAAVLYSRHPKTANFKSYSINATDRFLFSKHRNVFILILDSFQTDFFDEIIRESPGLARSFEGFTYFRNTLGGYPYTELSVALMLTGRYYDNSLPYAQWIKEAYEENSLPRVLKANGWRVDLFPNVSYSIYYSDKIASNFVRGIPLPERAHDIAYSFDLGLFRSLPHFLKRPVYNRQDWLVKRLLAGSKKKDEATRMVVPAGRNRRRVRRLFSAVSFRRSQDVKFINAMLAESTLSDDPGALKYYHLKGPHIPLLLDENLKYVEMESNRQNYQKAATASLKLVSLFLERLRRLGVYDESLIFIAGDHGAGTHGQNFVLQPGMPADGKGEVVTLPYRINALPLMLVKPMGATGDLKTSDAPVSVSDIPATVFSALGLSVDVPGDPLFSIDPSARRERRYLRYSGRDVYSYYGDMEEYIVIGPAWMDEAWRRTGRVFTKGESGLRERIP